jgi:sugar phosphate isomerase/epimerase
MASAHARLSVHSVSFSGAPLAELDRHWRALGLRRLSLIDTQLADPALRPLIERNHYAVETVCHLFAAGRLPTDPAAIAAARADLTTIIDAAASVGARTVYLLTGGRGPLTWEQAAAQFCSVIAPCVDHAAQAGVALAIENASSLYADIHFAHTLRDTVTLAEMAGIGICVDLFHCWAEADVAGLIRRALPRVRLIQLSDYVLGDRALPARAVPGDGVIPIEPIVAQVVSAGYPHGFDLELIGPRIDREGRFAAVHRACSTITLLLDKSGA